MKRNVGILLLSVFFMTALLSCEKKELLNQKTVFGEATINNKVLSQYMTMGMEDIVLYEGTTPNLSLMV